MKKKKRTAHIFVSFLFLSVSLLCSSTIYAQNSTVNLNYKDASFVEVINEFRKQTGVKFMYNLEKVKDKRCKDLTVKNIPTKRAIDIVLKHFNLAYSMVEGVVVVKEQPEEPQTKRTIKGTVFDETGGTLPGVTVLIRGTSMGVSTDAKGNFSITLPNQNENSLVFSFVGMQTQVIKCTDDKPLKITMKTDASQLEEVTVVSTGYNSLPRKDMVGAYTTVKAEDIMMPAYNSIDQMLQGKIPGMVVVNSSSRIGSTPKITIRGTSTIFGNTDPLWVVDGIIQPDPLPIDASSAITQDMRNLIGNQISWLNPSDIETITVLKDAPATAIYGSKASNGVIVITTKKGSAERTSIRYSTNLSFRTRPNYGMFNYMNSKERIQFSKEAYDAGVRYQSDPLPQIYTYEGLMAMYNNRLINEDDFMKQMKRLETCNTDWFDILCRNSFSHNHNLSISGGTQKVTYNASFGYSSNHGTQKGDDMTQFTSRLNVSTQFTKSLSITFNLSGSFNDKKGYGPGVSPENYATRTSRAIPAFDENGEYVFYKQYYGYQLNRTGQLEYGYNILNEMENSYSKNNSKNFNVSVNADWSITDWLKYQFVGSIAYSMNNSESFAGEKTSYIEKNYRGYAYGSETSGSAKFKAALLPFGGELATNATSNTSYNMQHKLVFSKTINEIHRINAMAGMEIRSEDNKNNTNTVWGYVPERGEILVSPTHPTEVTPVGGTVPISWGALDKLYQGGWKNTTITNNYVSFFATFAYSLKDRYVLNANIRSDASNRFGQDANKQFDPTYSLGVSWRMAEEEFVKTHLPWINQLNMRATYGVQGNVVTSVSPDLITQYQGILPGYNEYYLTISSLPNPLLKWERTKTWNVGLDLQLFNGITMSLEYYGRRSNAIINQDIAQEYGMNTMKLNGGRIHNHGLEFSMNITPYQRKDFAWTIGFNASKNWNKTQNDDIQTKANKITKSDFISGSSDRFLKKGYPLSAFWSYSFAGLDPETGYPTFNLIDFEEADPDIDPTTFLVYSGQKDPYFTGGVDTRIRYKSLSLGVNFSVLLGAKKRLPNPYQNFNYGKLPEPFYNLSKDLLKRWQKPGDEKHTIYPALYTSVEDVYNIKLPDGTAVNSIYEMWGNSDAMVVDASFLRCTQISLSWNVPVQICAKFGATNCSISANVNNPFVIGSSRFNGFDPELGDSVMPKVFSFGLSVGF